MVPALNTWELAEELLGVFMGLGLIFAREVQVDIRCFVAVEAQEGLKGDVVTILVHGGAAVRAVLGGQVKARAAREPSVKNSLCLQFGQT